MTLHKGADASTPGEPLPPGTEILAAYVGIPGQASSPDTPCIWTARDFNRYYETNPDLRFLPIYTHNYADGHPTADAMNAVTAIRELGWAPHMAGAAERILIIDEEVFRDLPYFTEMFNVIRTAGFFPVSYGSAAFVLSNPGPYWVANWTNRPPSSLPASMRGIQYASGPFWNLSVWSDAAWQACGTGPRHG
jgi:hypothetical protein